MDCHAHIVHGFKLDIQDVRIEKTKYDQDTGEPKQVSVVSHQRACINGVVVISKWTLTCGDDFEELRIFEAGDGYSEGQLFLGLSLAKTDMYDHWAELDYPRHNAVDVFAERYGLQSSLFLVVSFS